MEWSCVLRLKSREDEVRWKRKWGRNVKGSEERRRLFKARTEISLLLPEIVLPIKKKSHQLMLDRLKSSIDMTIRRGMFWELVTLSWYLWQESQNHYSWILCPLASFLSAAEAADDDLAAYIQLFHLLPLVLIHDVSSENRGLLQSRSVKKRWVDPQCKRVRVNRRTALSSQDDNQLKEAADPQLEPRFFF